MKYFAVGDHYKRGRCPNCFQSRALFPAIETPRLCAEWITGSTNPPPGPRRVELCRDCLEKISETRSLIDRK